MDCSLPGSSVHGDSPGKNSGGGLPNPGIEPKSPTLQVDSLPSEPPGKPKNTRVGSLTLLQGIFPDQGSDPCPLCWQTDSQALDDQEVPVLLC